MASSVQEHLEGLPEAVLTRLYQAPATCLAIFRLLPAMAKSMVMSMLFSDGPVKLDDIELWVSPSSRRLYAEAMKKLKGLHLIKERHQARTILLNPKFRSSLKDAITAGGSSATKHAFGAPCDTEDKHKVDIAFLDKHATEKWEAILHYMVGTPSTEAPSQGVLSLLLHSGLMEGRSIRDMTITNSGFQFLLQDVNAQIWTLLIQYLNMASSLQMDPVDVLNFVFMLGSLELGKDYTLSVLSDTQVKMLEDLRDFGLVYQRKSSSKRFYPTRLATTLTSDKSSLRGASSAMDEAIGTKGQGGFVILETNYRVYAYTDSPLQIAVLNLFVHLKSRFANMVTGHITRESVRNALRNGIQGEQIITYLTVHAHPQMQKNDPVLPPTVVDQIRLWQLEMDRLRATEGYLFKDFKSFADYKLVVTYAGEVGVLLWQDANKRRFFVSSDGGQQIVEFVNRKLKA
uniref:RNA polymerase II transcription factor B subunit 2 n=1 Tax=Blastobotrys adeninivorans TaxID=409370 RepID=A0A060T4X9_BLAAD